MFYVLVWILGEIKKISGRASYLSVKPVYNLCYFTESHVSANNEHPPPPWHGVDV